jgi:radical SAM enzyme (TIGR01210 family)
VIRRAPDLDSTRPWQFFTEEECGSGGQIAAVNTLFLTNRECPWKCVVCDLWQNTLTETVPVGAIPKQIDYALARLPASRVIKLYNSGSFFDPHAIPVADYSAIARRLDQFERVIVESHPALIGENCFRFRDLISGQLEVAMGLETVHPEVLARLNKGMTLKQFSRAMKWRIVANFPHQRSRHWRPVRNTGCGCERAASSPISGISRGFPGAATATLNAATGFWR